MNACGDSRLRGLRSRKPIGFRQWVVHAYEAYQAAHENENLQKGAAFQLIKAFLELNNTEFGRLVEVIIMSRNNANTCLRIFNSIQ